MKLLLCLLTACASVGVPPGYTTNRAGGVHDFDAFADAWKFHNKRLKTRWVGSTDWDEFPAFSCTTSHLGGGANVDEVYFPTKRWAGLTVRTFDTAKKQWSIYWVNSREGVMYPPVQGGFVGNIGEFYGEDTDGPRKVKVRFRWTVYSPDHLKWEQSFSEDGRTWEMNWTNELTRIDAAECVSGRPRASMQP